MSELEKILSMIKPVTLDPELREGILADAAREWRASKVPSIQDVGTLLARLEIVSPDPALRERALARAGIEWRNASSRGERLAELELFFRRFDSLQPDKSLRSQVLVEAEREWRRRPSLRKFMNFPTLLKLAASIGVAFVVLSQISFHGRDLRLGHIFSARQSNSRADGSLGQYGHFCDSEIGYDEGKARATVMLASLAEKKEPFESKTR